MIVTNLDKLLASDFNLSFLFLFAIFFCSPCDLIDSILGWKHCDC
jgi:hypothetical protein